MSFREADEYTDPDDPALTILRARVEPRHGGRPFRNTRHDGTPFEQRDRRASVLQAEGFAAWWVSFRPPPTAPGPVELTGRLSIDFGAQCPCWIRGPVSRLWMTCARREQPAQPNDPSSWEPMWGSQGRVALDEWPTERDGWPTLPPGATEAGRLVELDLDAVPDGHTGGVRLDLQSQGPDPQPARPGTGG